MKKLLLLSTLIIFAAVFYASESCSGQSLEFSLGLLEGDIYDCVMDLTQNVTQNIDGVEQRLDQRLIINWNYEVTGVGNDGIIDLLMTYQRIRINQDFGFNQSEFDSDNPPSYIEPSMRGYGALAGSVLEISMDNKGNVVRLAGVDDLIIRSRSSNLFNMSALGRITKDKSIHLDTSQITVVGRQVTAYNNTGQVR